MNILNIIMHPIGGIRSYLRYTYPVLQAFSYRTTVVTIDIPEARLLPEGMAPIPTDLELVPVRRALLHLLLRTRALVATGRFDLIHAQGLTAGIAGVIGNRGRVPIVVTLHETFDRDRFASLHGRIKAWALSAVLSRADRVILVGEDARANVLQHIRLSAAARNRMRVVHNGVAVDRLEKEAECVPQIAGLARPAGSLLLAYVGRFMPEKGFDLLIDAVTILSKETGISPFKILAVNDGAFIREYRGRIEARGLAPFFVFEGLQPSVAGILSNVDGVVVPSRREAFPLIALEALVLGCPLVASDCPGLREAVQGSPAIVHAAGDPASLAAALRQFLGAAGDVRRRALAYRTEARQRFDVRHAARELDQIFREVSGKPA